MWIAAGENARAAVLLSQAAALSGANDAAPHLLTTRDGGGRIGPEGKGAGSAQMPSQPLTSQTVAAAPVPSCALVPRAVPAGRSAPRR